MLLIKGLEVFVCKIKCKGFKFKYYLTISALKHFYDVWGYTPKLWRSLSLHVLLHRNENLDIIDVF